VPRVGQGARRECERCSRRGQMAPKKCRIAQPGAPDEAGRDAITMRDHLREVRANDVHGRPCRIAFMPCQTLDIRARGRSMQGLPTRRRAQFIVGSRTFTVASGDLEAHGSELDALVVMLAQRGAEQGARSCDPREATCQKRARGRSGGGRSCGCSGAGGGRLGMMTRGGVTPSSLHITSLGNCFRFASIHSYIRRARSVLGFAATRASSR
jgi:hypothetical protein